MSIIEQITAIVGAASEATDAAGGAVDVVQRVKGLFGQSKTGTDPAVISLLSDAVAKVCEAQVANAKLQMKVIALNSELQRKHAIDKELARYELKVSRSGALYCPAKPSKLRGDPPHSICADCYAEGRKSFLHGGGQKNALTCNKCDKTIYI